MILTIFLPFLVNLPIFFLINKCSTNIVLLTNFGKFTKKSNILPIIIIISKFTIFVFSGTDIAII